MTINDLIEKLQGLRDDLKELDVVIYAPNGLCFDPKVKFEHEYPYPILMPGNVKRAVIVYE